MVGKQHVYAAATTIVLGIVAAFAIAYDRRTPLDITSVVIAPVNVDAGDWITVRKSVTWRRRCVGEVYRQIVGADREVRVYTREWIGPPYRPGDTIESNRVQLSIGLPSGEAVYRSAIIFRNCGFTSRWWTIDVISPETPITIQAIDLTRRNQNGEMKQRPSHNNPFEPSLKRLMRLGFLPAVLN